ncbi:MAG: PaaI family thioesterase [Sandaracinus sp.]|nr:PaaI family thioesterase [Myxococcales bacterium]MCB9604039.1 PaaI family thioesterase [Sandaracinus sp.]MCB9612928.1 PaaI family thioesterase [Sandaracinus sp.]MCB9623094.1 PaaI family thioesterase [Sandaracinus sp.]MCB9631834.1 PaaI family thioesterase [Sandaracinus sp.]
MIDHAELLNGMRRGWDAAMGLRWVRATEEELVAELDVDERHLQQYGLVHGGVHSGLIEVLCSAGAALRAMARGQGGAVGLENHTSFLKAARGGVLRATARPITCGRRTHVWEAEVRDADGELLATGRVRLMVLERGEKPGKKEES